MPCLAFAILSLLIHSSLTLASPVFRWDMQERAANTRYSYVVAFGDSYTTNNATSLGNGYAPNRLSNGLVAIENLANLQGLPLRDYAIGGATIDNTGAGAGSNNISVAMQVQRYLAERKAGFNFGSRRTLFIVFIGVNDLFNIVSNNDPGNSASDTTYKYNQVAYERATKIYNVIGQIEEARKNDGPGGYDFLILQAPQLELTPRGRGFANGSAYRASVLREMTNTYNQQITDGGAYFNNVLRSRGRYATTYATGALYRDFHANPSKYGFTNVLDTAFEHQNEDVDKYLYWDGFTHPTRAGHSQIAKAVNPSIITNPTA